MLWYIIWKLLYIKMYRKMKTLDSILKRTFLLVLVTITSFTVSQAQESKKDKEAAIKSIVESGNYTFRAQSVTPTGGRFRQLAPEYDMSISKDLIVTHLPYFGRAYSAPISSTQGGIQFTSKDFEYTVKDRKKGGWDILIRPKDASDIQQLFLSITKSGYASLQVTSNNRQPISFNGYITEKK